MLKIIGQYDIKHIMTLSIETITAVLKVSIYIICIYIYIIQSSVNCDDNASVWTDHIFTINQWKKRKKVTYLHLYKMENCLDVAGLDLWFELIQSRSIQYQVIKHSKGQLYEERSWIWSSQWRVSTEDYLDNMKQPAAILVLWYWYTILVIPVFYQYLPVSAILVQILVDNSIPISSRIFQYLQY
jgi:hypothetical protein